MHRPGTKFTSIIAPTGEPSRRDDRTGIHQHHKCQLSHASPGEDVSPFQPGYWRLDLLRERSDTFDGEDAASGESVASFAFLDRTNERRCQ